MMHAIKGDYKTTVYYDNLSDIEMLDGLANGYNPFTGEVFDEKHFLCNPKIKKLLTNIYNDYKDADLFIKKVKENVEFFKQFE